MADKNEDCPPNEDDAGVSMVDVLEEEEQLEADANAVLGDSDDKNCTYEKGYISRQAVYACTTCTPPSLDDAEPGGICLACSYECHEGHNLLELYTKRNFRCDCGNSKFPNFTCKIFANKESTNTKNKYNQNFCGAYCTCARPYPDLDDSVEDDMIQCIVCEDWYHGRHLGTPPPNNQDFMEMICDGCMKSCGFLWAYTTHSVETTKLENSDSAVDVNVEDVQDDSAQTDCEKNRTKAESVASQAKDLALANKINDGTKTEQSDEQSATELLDAQKEPEPSTSCKLQELKQRDIPCPAGGATYWPDRWRSKLCVCRDCKKLYEEKQVPFLPDEGDTVHAYEERGRGKESGQSQYDRGMNVLSNMGRIQQVEVLRGYIDMKEELTEYLKKFADNGKMVREEDIREFFTELQKKKRQRLDGPPQFHCK